MRKFKELNKKSGQIYNNFLKVSTLNGSQMDDDTADDQLEQIQLSKTRTLTDEELFKACGGRTAHKGARHGLKQSGKLARLAEQDRHLIDSLAAKTDKSNPTSIFGEWTSVKSKKNSKRMKCQPQPQMSVILMPPEEDESEILKGIIDNDTDYSEDKDTMQSKKFKRKVEYEMSETLSAALTLDSCTPLKRVSFQAIPTTIYPREDHTEPFVEKSRKQSTRKLSKKKKKQLKQHEEDAAFEELAAAKVEQPKKSKKRNAEEAQLDKPILTPTRPSKNQLKFVSEDEDSEDGHTTDSSTGGLKPRKSHKIVAIPISANAFSNLINEDDEYARNKKKYKRKVKSKRRTYEKNQSSPSSMEMAVRFPVKKSIKKDITKSSKRNLKKKVLKLSTNIENFVLSFGGAADDGDVEIQ